MLTNSGGLTITTPNTVIQNLNITGNGSDPPLLIKASGCVVKSCRIDAIGAFFGIDAEAANGVTSITIQDCTIFNSNSGNADCVMVLAAGGTILRNNISGGVHSYSVDGGTTLIQDNYMHDLFGSVGGHYENIFWGGVTPAPSVMIKHNTFFAFDTADVFVQNTFGDVSGTIIDNNLMRQQTPVPVATLHSTSETVQIQGTGTSTGCQITNNIIEVGFFDYAAVSGNAAPGCLWQNNTDYFTGSLIATPPNCFTP